MNLSLRCMRMTFGMMTGGGQLGMKDGAPVEKATSLAAPAAPEPRATSGAAVSAVTW